MKKVVLAIFILSILMIISCDSEKAIVEIFDGSKLFYIILEAEPEEKVKKVQSKGFDIGEVLTTELGADNMVVVTIKVLKNHVPLYKKNVVFYRDNDRLVYDTIGESEEMLKTGAKILGFSSKTSLVWFKTKNNIKALSKKLTEKAEELYKKATRGGEQNTLKKTEVDRPRLSMNVSI